MKIRDGFVSNSSNTSFPAGIKDLPIAAKSSRINHVDIYYFSDREENEEMFSRVSANQESLQECLENCEIDL